MTVTVVCIITRSAELAELTIKRITLINIPILQQLVLFMDELNIFMQVATKDIVVLGMVTQDTRIATQTVMI
jgi:hypothetical protein